MVEVGTMIDEMVVAVYRVIDIIGEIGVASEKQSSDIEQVNRTIT